MWQLPYSCRILDVQACEEGDGEHAVLASVDIVPEKKVIGHRARAADAKELQKVLELAVDVADYGHGRGDLSHVRRIHEHLFEARAQ